MDCEENIQNGFAGNDLWVKFDRHHLGMAGGAVANTLVVGVWIVSPGITAGNVANTLELNVGRVEAPETTAGESEFFHCSHKLSPVVFHSTDERYGAA